MPVSQKLGVFCAIPLCFCTTMASTAEWENDLSLALGSYFSDNICRAPNITEDKVVGTVTPGIRLRGDGARANISLDAAVEYNSLGESSIECVEQGGFGGVDNRETWAPRVNMASEFEALENFLFLDATAFAAQNPINPFAAGGNDNINATGNQNITYRWGVGGRIDRRVSERWAVLARYNYNEQYNSRNQALGDSQEDRVDLDVGMIPQASRFSLGIAGQYSEVDFDATDIQPAFTNRLSRLEVRSGLQLSRSFSLDASAGEEDNVFLSQSDEIDGSYWDVGFSWRPNDRVFVAAGYGERFFGETPRFSINYRHKRTQLEASYQRDLQFPRNIRAADGGGDPDDPFDPGLGLPGEPIPGDGDPTFIGQTPVLNERFRLSYRFDARRTSWQIFATDSDQTRAEDGRTGNFRSVNGRITRSLGRGISLDFSIGWRDNEGQLNGAAGIEDQNLEAFTAGVGLQKRIGRGATLIARYRHTDQKSTSAFNEFEENRIDLGLRFDF